MKRPYWEKIAPSYNGEILTGITRKFCNLLYESQGCNKTD